ncbi:MAG: DUF4430 domain-containing protein [Gemmiger sp.]|nr:DUF4430 domain-containing protein [Gemmiger sp.]
MPQTPQPTPQPKKNTLRILVIAAALVAALLACWAIWGPKATAIGGSKTLTVQVVCADATEDFTFTTDAEFLRQALEEQKLVTGTESDYGLFVTTVNGVTADDAKQEWWCFTQNGTTLMTGVDTTPVADGDHFEITLTTGYE